MLSSNENNYLNLFKYLHTYEISHKFWERIRMYDYEAILLKYGNIKHNFLRYVCENYRSDTNDLIDYLINNGADINYVGELGATCLRNFMIFGASVDNYDDVPNLAGMIFLQT